MRDRFLPGRVARDLGGFSLDIRRLPFSAFDHDKEDETAREEFVQFARGRLRLLNTWHAIGNPVDWRRVRLSSLVPLARFHLHYQEYLLPWAHLPETGPVLQAFLSSWLDAYETGGGHWRGVHGIVWHPYVISRRLVVWIHLLATISLSEELRERMVRSLVAQADWLERHLEWDIEGNHLWENARALALVGSAGTGRRADRWWRVGRDLLNDAIASQLLPWGEHFERSPMYQWDLARSLSDLACWVDLRDGEQADRWRSTAERMARWVEQLRHPDGSMPLLGDSTWDDPDLRPGRTISGEDSGWVGEYFVHREQGNHLVFDAGDMGADSLPAHAHADILGFEMSWQRERLFVDRGVHAYSGPTRQEYRQSSSHNVVVVDGVELADTWSSFRMGRRGHVVERHAGNVDAGTWIHASHDCYRRLGIPCVHRYWLLVPGGPWFCWNVIEGKGPHQAVSYLWLAEDQRVVSADDSFRVSGLKSVGAWGPIGSGRVVVRSATRSNRFSRAERCLVIEQHLSFVGSGRFGWMIAAGGSDTRARVSRVADGWRFHWRSGPGPSHTTIPAFDPVPPDDAGDGR